MKVETNNLERQIEIEDMQKEELGTKYNDELGKFIEVCEFESEIQQIDAQQESEKAQLITDNSHLADEIEGKCNQLEAQIAQKQM